MYKIGIDMTTVSRIEKSCGKESFRNYVFTKGELDLFYNNREKPKYSSLAANFAAKEAFSKALGTGIRGFDLSEVEILRDELGAPYFNFYGKAADIVFKAIIKHLYPFLTKKIKQLLWCCWKKGKIL